MHKFKHIATASCETAAPQARAWRPRHTRSLTVSEQLKGPKEAHCTFLCGTTQGTRACACKLLATQHTCQNAQCPRD